MEFFATEVMEKRASGPVVPTARAWNHAAHGALPGAVVGGLLGGVMGSMGDGESHGLRDALIGATAGGLATGGRSYMKAQAGGVSRFAMGPAVLRAPKMNVPGAPLMEQTPENASRLQSLAERRLNRPA